MSQIDWEIIRADYIAGGLSVRELVERYNVSFGTIKRRCKEEKWVELRKKRKPFVDTNLCNRVNDKQITNVEIMEDITTKMLKKIEKAVDECDLVMVEEITKTKSIEFEEDEIGRKLPKTVEKTNKAITSKRCIIDKAGIKQLTSALRDIKDIRGYKTELDKEEQKAKIALLRKQYDEGNVNKDIKIIFGDGIEKYAK